MACEEGVDATYCCSAPECHAGKFAFGGNAPTFFRCHDRDKKSVEKNCGGAPCFGTSCSCDPGETCVETGPKMPLGKTCLLLSGGNCVSNTTAEVFYGFSPGDLLPCCSGGCLKGAKCAKCDAGWQRLGGKYAYQRVIGTCGSCGNGVYDPGEYPKTCPADCTCGDGVCAPGELDTCKTD